ncbi:MAG TPA: hypothetical protein VFH61_18905 [Thermoleophilia bacterium]|nr:hypothetical protein [Thermoleophilia bacterium]
MIVTLEIPPESQRRIAEHGKLAGRVRDAIADGLESAVVAGAENVREQLIEGQLGLTMQRPAEGLASSLSGWMIDRAVPLAAVGVPGNSPAAVYAGFLETGGATGGTITAKPGHALAIPISDEAKKYSSPRDMPGLELIPRKGKPPLLVRMLSSRGNVRGFELHWVLVKSVTIEPRHWLSRGVDEAVPVMVGTLQDVLNEYAEKW